MDGKDETGCKIDITEKNGKDLDHPSMTHDVEESKNENHPITNYDVEESKTENHPIMNYDVEESKNLKRNVGCSTDQPLKYQRLGKKEKLSEDTTSL